MTTTVSTTDGEMEGDVVQSTPSTEDEMPQKLSTFGKVVAQLSPRRQFLVNRRRQLRSAFLVAVVVLLLLLPLNYSLHTVREQETTTITTSNPELKPLMQSRDKTEFIVGLLASVVILAGVFILTIVETHRTSGAAFALVRRLDEIREGQLGTRLTLRGGDNLREIEGPFNAMVEALRTRAVEEANDLDKLAAKAGDIVVPREAESIAHKLRSLARRKREMAGVGSARKDAEKS